MLLGQLGIHNLRSIKEAHLHFCAGTHLVYGANGSGKTSVLEALSLLSRGRSFAATNNRELIAIGSESLVCSLDLRGANTHKIGIQIDRDANRQLRLDGQFLPGMQKLALLLPMLFVTPRSFELLEGSSKERRRMVDWLAFHVKPGFAAAHASFSRLLAQRNAQLKQPQTKTETWDRFFIEASEKLHRLREEVFLALKPHMEQHLQQWLAEKAIDCTIHPGWASSGSLEEQLHKDIEQDRKRGFTARGAHRFDLRFATQGHKAAQILSRGEKKRLILALVFAQLQLVQEAGGSPTLVVDDLPAELDEMGCQQTLENAARRCAQVFVTGIEKTNLEKYATRAFHVERGRVTQE